MSSLVAEVLMCASSGILDRNDLQNEITRISRRMESIKLQVQSVLSSCHVDFDPFITSAVSAENNLCQLSSEANALKNKIHKELKPQLSNAVSEYEDLALRVQKTTLLADIVGHFVAIHEALQGSEDALFVKEYVKATKLLEEAGNKLSSTASQWVNTSAEDLEILSSLRTDWIVQKEKLIFSLGQLWTQFILWVDQDKSTHLRVCCKLEFCFNELVQALHTLEQLERKIQVFAKSFMAHLVGPVLRQESEVVVNETSSYKEIGLRLVSGHKPKASSVVRSLKIVFKFINEAFKNFENANSQSDVLLMTQFGKVCAEEFVHRLIKECLEPAVPSQSGDFDAYRVVSAEIQEFEVYLKDIGFLASHHALSYAQNVDSLFANKKCQEILVQGREIMKEDLHMMVSSDILTSDDKFDFGGNGQHSSEKLDDLKDAFNFPVCQISAFTGKILDQLHTVLEEACRCNNKDLSARLFYTARHLSHMYCDVVPIYHQDSITMFPQQTALHHNNCMFLAHNLLTLGHGYQKKLSQKGVNGPKTFIDIALQLRTIGTEAFLEQMRRQRTILLEFLQDSGVFQDMSSEEFLPKGNRAVKQCLVHLFSLKKVWERVLPWGVYLRSVGTLCNSCVEELIFRVVSQDDITEKTAGYLDTILTTLNNQMPKLFELPAPLEQSRDKTCDSLTDNQEADWKVLCIRHIKKWAKFQEVRIVLKSSLRDIVERWASGQGPLASEATAEEVKQLIRALFQNTDRRAAALAKIK